MFNALTNNLIVLCEGQVWVLIGIIRNETYLIFLELVFNELDFFLLNRYLF